MERNERKMRGRAGAAMGVAFSAMLKSEKGGGTSDFVIFIASSLIARERARITLHCVMGITHNDPCYFNYISLCYGDYKVNLIALSINKPNKVR